MASNYKGPLDYVDVAARIVEFREKHPDGALQPADPAQPYRIETISGVGADGKPVEQTFIVVVAAAYRGPQDERPGIGMAYEVFPGRTQFTRGSELQNAETSAWGRAIVAALAADTRKGIASQEEVRNRRAEQEESTHQAAGVVAEAEAFNRESFSRAKARTTDPVVEIRLKLKAWGDENGKSVAELDEMFAAWAGATQRGKGDGTIAKADKRDLDTFLRSLTGEPRFPGDEEWATPLPVGGAS